MTRRSRKPSICDCDLPRRPLRISSVWEPRTGAGVMGGAAVPLRGNATNVIVVTATTASGFPFNGGTTTFSDTIFVQSLPITVRLNFQASILTLSWMGGTGPYRVQKATNLSLGDWQDYLTNAQPPITLEADDLIGFYRVVEP